MKKLIILLVIVSCASVIEAGDKTRKGTTGADQLLVPVGARSIATGGAFLSNVKGLEALYYNPAGFAHFPGSEAMFSYMSYIADINVSYFAIGTNLGDLGSFAFNIKTFDIGDIPVTTFEAPDGDGTTYSPGFITAGISYSKIITDRVSIGISGKIISESIMDVNATGFALDFGVQYRFANNLSLGATVMNIGTNMEYTGSNLQVNTGIPGSQEGSPGGSYQVVPEAFQIPSYFELSLGYEFDINEQNMLNLASTFRNNNALEDQMKFGLEYGFAKTFFVRGGYDFLVENTDQSIFGLTFGAGIDYNVGGDIGIAFDYAFRDVKEFPTANHIFTIKLSFQ
ncbi:MAG TPA: PorV/PorQ family protein [Ignavibacteriaceae bacterium]|nr:PorV/PorQ family protein [Ignavibacteriaceae bacterium]